MGWISKCGTARIVGAQPHNVQFLHEGFSSCSYLERRHQTLDVTLRIRQVETNPDTAANFTSRRHFVSIDVPI